MMPSSSGRNALYRIGAVVAAIAIAATVFDIVLSMLPGWGGATTPASAAAWLQQLATTPLLGLRNLDLLNVGVSIMSLPMYLALHAMLRDRQPGPALIGTVIAVVGATLFAASNAALPMLGLARQYAAAAGTADRAPLLAAANSLLARGAHGSLGALPGFLLSEIGTLLVALGMARASDARGLAGWVGVTGAGALIAYSLVATFGAVPADKLTLLAAPGGLMVLAWQVAVVRRLASLGWPRDAAAGTQASPATAAALES